MSAKLDDKRRLKLAAQGLRKTAISLQAAVVSLLQTADALTAETDDNLVENNPLDVNLQELLKGDINSALIKLLNDALNNYGEALDDDQRAKQNGKRAANGLKKTTRKPKPPRDPNAPIKPQNAFILYQKDIANQVKAEHEGKPWSEIVHLISIRWRNLPKEEKDVYELKFKDAKRRYEAENKIYMENKDQVVAAADPDGHDDNNNDTSESVTPDSQSTASQSEEEEEDDDDMPNPSVSRSSRSKVKSSASTKNTSYSNPESSSKKKSKKRKPQDDDDESNNEEEEHYELPKKPKKKVSNEESGEVQGKSPKKIKKEDKDLDMEGKSKKKKSSKKSRQD